MIIATHSGSFHADEVTACVIFKLLDATTKIIRSRDPEELEKADYVIDVSGKFDLQKHFDHHPAEFNMSRSNGIKYATAGLIWDKFGRELLELIRRCLPNPDEISDTVINKAWKTIDRNIMQYTDLTDNGQLDSYTKGLCSLSSSDDNQVYSNLNRFYMHIPVIPYLVAMQNDLNGNDEVQYRNFMETVESLKVLYKKLFINTLTNARDEEKVLKSYDGSEILRLDEKLPWFEAVLNNWSCFEKCKIAIYPDHKKNGYRIQSLPGSQSSRFKNRCGAPTAWRGKELEELNRIIGIKTATFVHKTGFTGGAVSKEDIEIMARLWIDGSEP
ncbi:MYG1 family protein [uncultured Ruminobacter sp.]|jgi:uncharacterized UPF0160 family protein|uniref:MYG1 family protein n=1 Tax=Ruminobacter sp. TaxID=2774296 RepID=UPI0025FCF9BA|nr:MYG1 family protein [uncultured Ruminobacter sp.]